MDRLYRSGQGAPLLLLHCLGVDHHLWDIAAADLAGAFTLLSLDFPGHGNAPPAAGSYAIADLSAQIADLMQRESVSRAHVAGISLGGLVAQHLAATRPDLVDHVILIDTTPRYVDAARANWAVRAHTARTAGVAAMTDSLLPVWFTQPAIDADGSAIRYVRDCFARCNGEAYALACEALAAADLLDLVPQIAAPALVVCGEEDVPPFIDAARYLAAHLPRARSAWLSPARHASILEQPASFATAIRAFLASNVK